MNQIIQFINSYRRLSQTPVVDDDFPQIMHETDSCLRNLLPLIDKFKDVEVICLCGSTKFKDEFIEMNKQFSLQGKIVLSVGHFNHSDSIPCTHEEKVALDELHKRKIDLADTVFIINKGGYIGESTQSEIEYATQQNKLLTYYQ